MTNNLIFKNNKNFSGWGGYPVQKSNLFKPKSTQEYSKYLNQKDTFIARGMGRSYGDSAIGDNLLKTTSCDHFILFDTTTGIFTAEAGITLHEILKVIVKKGWFLPVTPGSSLVTLGGAVASDVHGKNHHIAGTFSQHVISLTLLTGKNEIVTTSKEKLNELFRATCGGMGLTGIILTVTIKLIPIRSALISQKITKANSLEECCELFEEHNNSTYSVAWIDCLISGKQMGRSILITGEHLDNGSLNDTIKNSHITIPNYKLSYLMNNITIKMFNNFYWIKARQNKIDNVRMFSYFYPLDTIGNWNKLYGKAGFLQYQFVLPKEYGITNMRKVLSKILSSGETPYLSVLKKFGPANENFLSFPIEGYTLALDFKFSNKIIELLHKLDDIIIEMGGKIYLTKDAVMKERTFKKTYSKWEEFEHIRHNYGALGKFSSAQSKRLGLA
jgi:decaprenylphospho-beta-D-ribofuranose 2-oxidase